FDLWINFANVSSTEHTMFGINHSGNVANQITVENSDGIFFAMDGDGGASSTATSARDYSVLQGGGPALPPLLLITNNTTFGPAPVLGGRFDNTDSGFSTNFPARTINGISVLAGAPGLRWLTIQVMQKDSLITWMINSNIVAQYTNNTLYTSGDVMVGYND